jgi:hypothetical protein
VSFLWVEKNLMLITLKKLQQNNRKQIAGQNNLSGVLKEEKGHIALLNVDNIFLVIFWNFFK